MKRYHLALHKGITRRPPLQITTLDWTHFALLAGILAGVLLLAAFMIWPW